MLRSAERSEASVQQEAQAVAPSLIRLHMRLELQDHVPEKTSARNAQSEAPGSCPQMAHALTLILFRNPCPRCLPPQC